ncbi:hypothetical protein P2G88_18640 [Aliiglaciecola sp. CAU 1673]|nr:hypothetical protein [Aliiglaciecola sp. CAU 1673]MDF2180279.1 hypothetical protein [Aliiglaciecola sp. CAU 1673]
MQTPNKDIKPQQAVNKPGQEQKQEPGRNQQKPPMQQQKHQEPKR